MPESNAFLKLIVTFLKDSSLLESFVSLLFIVSGSFISTFQGYWS